MKRVSFKVAKSLKEAGYPQGESYASYLEDVEGEGHLMDKDSYDYSAPTYLDVLLWLWREKKIYIDITCHLSYACVHIYNNNIKCIENKDFYPLHKDPEEAIEKAVEYLVTNDLIK